jgi:hypothetical protein
MYEIANEIAMLNDMIIAGFSFGALLVTTYYRYEKNYLFTLFGNLFIKLSFTKRDKTDLLMFSIIPFTVGVFALIFRLALL